MVTILNHIELHTDFTVIFQKDTGEEITETMKVFHQMDLKRTIAGVYPAGGAFDDESYQSLGLGDGLGGLGVTPVMLNTWMHFMNAEVAVMTGGDPTTETLAAIRSSLNKVDDIAGAPAMDAAAIDSYIANFRC